MRARAYMEPFRLLEAHSTDDGMGGACAAWTEGAAFLGAVGHVEAREVQAGGLQAAAVHPSLLHEDTVMLLPGQRIKRMEDGAVYRVLGSSCDMRAPKWTKLHLCQVPVERLVTS